MMGADLVGQEHFDHVTGPAALDQTQSSFGNETAHGDARRSTGDVGAPSEPGYREAKLTLPWEAAVL